MEHDISAEPAIMRAFLHLPERLLPASRLAIDEGIAMNDTQLLSLITGNAGTFRRVICSALLLAKRIAHQSGPVINIFGSVL